MHVHYAGGRGSFVADTAAPSEGPGHSLEAFRAGLATGFQSIYLGGPGCHAMPLPAVRLPSAWQCIANAVRSVSSHSAQRLLVAGPLSGLAPALPRRLGLVRQ